MVLTSGFVSSKKNRITPKRLLKGKSRCYNCTWNESFFVATDKITIALKINQWLFLLTGDICLHLTFHSNWAEKQEWSILHPGSHVTRQGKSHTAINSYAAKKRNPTKAVHCRQRDHFAALGFQQGCGKVYILKKHYWLLLRRIVRSFPFSCTYFLYFLITVYKN